MIAVKDLKELHLTHDGFMEYYKLKWPMIPLYEIKDEGHRFIMEARIYTGSDSKELWDMEYDSKIRCGVIFVQDRDESAEEFLNNAITLATVNNKPLYYRVYDNCSQPVDTEIRTASDLPLGGSEQKKDDEDKAKSIFSTEEEWYKEIAYHCWLSNNRVGDAYEGMKYDFDCLWECKKHYLTRKINEQLDGKKNDD